MKRRITALLITIMAVAGASLGIPTPDAFAQASAEYSCGTYGSGEYSTGNNCSENNNVAAPNTGFARLTEPQYSIPIGLSLLAIIAGVLLLVRRRRA